MVETKTPSSALQSQIDALQSQRRVPCATYRFQFNAGFPLDKARALLDYLNELGISDLYSSPLLRALPGSTHGYDICSPAELNPELGGQPAFDALAAALRERGMGLLLDVVPNHMGIEGNCNAWWQDVLENGPASRYAAYFDIDWDPVKPELKNRLLLPILGDQYGNELLGGKFAVTYDQGEFKLTYGPYRFPIAPRSYGQILEELLRRLLRVGSADAEQLQELRSILTQIRHIPGRNDILPEQRDEREREKQVIKRRLAALADSSDELQAQLDETLRALNGVTGDPRSFDLLDTLISDQAYRLAYWRVAGEEINYRRFFDINAMAAIRNELPEVFEATHGLIFALIAGGQVTGLRIDHPDGLWNPPQYFRRLQEHYLLDRIAGQDDVEAVRAVVDAWLDVQARIREHVDWPLYVVAEKILTENEPLPSDWAVYGTTGYDFMNVANGIFVNAANERAFDEIYAGFTGRAERMHELEYVTKKMIMQESLASEVNSLAHQLERIAERTRHFRDFTLNGLLHAIREFIACLPIYRAYITAPDRVSSRDQFFVESAAAAAARLNPRTSRAVFNFLRDTLLLRNVHEFRPDDQDEIVRFVMRFQQITGPVMAKSVEDTAFYIYNRLVSLNEVGGSPAQFGLPLETFHAWNARRVNEWPHAMVSLSTHDTKRSEDVRARLNVLSEIPDEWAAAVKEWQAANAAHKTSTEDGPAPDSNDEYLLYQTLLGAWPVGQDELKDSATWTAFTDRVAGYMAKATREAKVHTSWTNANEVYDRAVDQFVRAVLQPSNRAFLDAFLPLQRRIAFYGRLNSLSQTLLKLTAPGVPDTYRGTEVWDFSLVDPDNRRPVDWDRLCDLLTALRERMRSSDRLALVDELLRSSTDGRIKLYTVHAALSLRREHEALFSQGDYLPLDAEGDRAAHVCAFARRFESRVAVAVAPRLVVGLLEGQERPPMGDVWGETKLLLPPAMAGKLLTNVLTGEDLVAEAAGEAAVLPLSAVLGHFPVALLTAEKSK